MNASKTLMALMIGVSSCASMLTTVEAGEARYLRNTQSEMERTLLAIEIENGEGLHNVSVNDDRLYFFIPNSKISGQLQYDRQLISGWFQLEHLETRFTGSDQYRSDRFQLYASCESKQIALGNGTYFSGNLLSGEVTKTFTYSDYEILSDLTPVAPGTIGEGMWDTLCDPSIR